MTETDIIGHLIDIESQAASLLMDAQNEVDKRVAETKKEADSKYKIQYEKMIGELESEFNKQKKETDQKCLESISAYKSKLESQAQNKEEFNSLVESYLYR